MKTKLHLMSTNLYKYCALVAFSLLLTNLSYGQQVIGEFPVMDGGMESQAAGTIPNIGSSAAGTTQTMWSVSSSSNSAQRLMVNDPTLARTGNMSADLAVAMGKSNVRLQSPSSVAPNAIDTGAEYTIQYFYKTTTDPGSFLDGGIYLNSTSGGSAGDINPVGGFTANTWVKGYETRTTNTIFDLSNWAVARISVSPIDSYLDTIKFDDFVIYAGTFDSTAPDAPTNASTFYTVNVTSADLAWTAPSTGVDGGGYVVVKYLTMPAADNDISQNGIYAIGSTTTNGTASLLGTVVYIGTGTSYSDTYTAGAYYKVYTADKAFNYSGELTLEEDTSWPVSVSTNEISDVSIYPNPVRNTLRIKSDHVQFDVAAIYNLEGKLVLEVDALSNSTMDVSSLASGTYVLKLTSKLGIVSKEIIIE